jgi:hypothetical protein
MKRSIIQQGKARATTVGAVTVASLLTLFSVTSAQNTAPPTGRREATPALSAGATVSNPPQQSLTEQILRGRAQLEAGNRAAINTFQAAAQQSLTPLIAAAGPEILTKDPALMPGNSAFGAVARQAAEAHYWWGVAADRFAERNIALTAFSRAVRFSLADKSGTYSPAREALPNLLGALSDGLPIIAPDDTLQTIASIAHGNLWRPLRLTFDFPDGAFEAASGSSKNQREFLITDGRVFVKAPGRPEEQLQLRPPPFRNVSRDALPSVLLMSAVVVGFVREQDGPDKGMWRQLVRVHYPNRSHTKNGRDDQPRAEALCLQFLKLHALQKSALGLENPYRRGPGNNITTLWLSEVSALWPRDEDDPSILASLGMVYMPKVNIPSGKKPTAPTEVEGSPVLRPWLAAGQLGDDPGDVIVYKVAEPRSEAEWLRQLAHEYGHVTLPPFNGFRPPLEPFANGTLGETLSMLWAAGAPDAFTAPLREITTAKLASRSARLTPIASPAGAAQPQTGNDGSATFHREVESHVAANALPCLNAWNEQGPGSPLRRDTSVAGLRYLQGLGAYIERVYGARVLGNALRRLPRTAEAPVLPEEEPEVPSATVAGAGNPGSMAVGASGQPPGVVLRSGTPTPAPTAKPPLQSTALLNSLPLALKDAYAENKNRLPIWLPGALSTPTTQISAAELIARAPVGLKAGERATAWLFIPADTDALRIEWKTQPGALPIQVEGGWKIAPLAPATAGATHAIRIDTSDRSGWQRFAFTSPTDLTWSGAWFGKSK